jgi:hypothetical protein
VERYTTTVISSGKRVLVPVPFDPDAAWGPKREHRVHGTIGGHRVRASLESHDGGVAFVLPPSWRRDCGMAPGDVVDVALEPEGPQRADLAPDLAEAFEANPEAGAFFDSLAQFYRKAYLRYVDATKRRPDERVRRIHEVVDLCARGMKERSS